MCLPTNKEILTNLGQIRLHCLASIGEAEAQRDDRGVRAYIRTLEMIDSIIEDMGGTDGRRLTYGV